MIVGIGSVARVGKDTAATALVRDLGFKRIGFADALKRLALEADPMISPSGARTVNTQGGRGHLKQIVTGSSWEQAKDQWPEIRRFLQELGVGCRRVFGDGIWIQAIEQAMKVDYLTGDWVVPDVRFINEADWVKAQGGITVRIDRPGFFGAGHISETELNKYTFDYALENDGSIQQLERKVVDLVRGLQQKALKDAVAEA